MEGCECVDLCVEGGGLSERVDEDEKDIWYGLLQVLIQVSCGY